ncbi:MAG: primosomal protein N' [Candidatus Cloacimonetes bacterium]|nr:primosomal protein N' [Candidatus Cloacimonadota bacterium]
MPITMHYYKIALPLGINRDFSYSSQDPIPLGARVLVPLKAKLMLGICLESHTAGKLNYKSVAEVLDDTAILPLELIKLARWMSEYYHCSMGKALFAMLPAKLQSDVDAELIWIGPEEDIPPQFEALYRALIHSGKSRICDLRKSFPNLPIYRLCEAAATAGLLKIDNKLRHKDKPKILNFIQIISSDFDPDTLPLRQREAWELIKTQTKPFPMADISNVVSYSSLKALVKKGIIKIFPREVQSAQLLRDTGAKAKNIVLNDAQISAISEISSDFGSFQVHLLYGITGSGKTEVYIEIIRKYLNAGKSVIFLIPEIALTPQMLDKFDASFGEQLAILHSQLTDTQRFAQWQKLQNGECRIALGARSAIFAPVQNLGLIIVDEEHEQSYKQDSQPRYNGRDVAIVRAQQQGAQVILGSATPSLESWNNSMTGKYKLHKLLQRPMNYKLPEVRILDLCDCDSTELISDDLAKAIAQRLDRKEQVILFQNRRGYSSFVQCLKCGKLITCPNCEISMYYHRDREEMQCHYCGSFYPVPRRCPSCNSFTFSYGSPGTQKVEQSLKILFPMARILRLDSDSSRINLKSMYQRMKKHELDILLGTQMITKGLDFPNVTLVGIVNADISLNIPDFRSAERTFQLLTQVAGRSGRAEKKGEVIIQTYNPEHYAIQYASHQDFEGFARVETALRKRLYYPPYYRLARILYQSADEQEIVSEMARLSRDHLPKTDEHLLILGPAPAPFTKINNMYRHHLILKGYNPAVLKQAIDNICNSFKTKLYFQIDIDPSMLM